MLVILVIYCDIMMLNLIKVKFLGGEARKFGGEASPLSPPLDETLVAACMIIKFAHYVIVNCMSMLTRVDFGGGISLSKRPIK